MASTPASKSTVPSIISASLHVVGNLVSVFKEVGWEVQAETVSGISLKPGVMTLVGEEQYPSYVDTVLKALRHNSAGVVEGARA